MCGSSAEEKEKKKEKEVYCCSQSFNVDSLVQMNYLPGQRNWV